MAEDTKPAAATEDGPTEAQALSMGKLMHTLAADPKHRKDVLGLVKRARPDLVIPELEIEETASRIATERSKPLEEQNKALAEKLDKIERHLAREQWKVTSGLDDEEIVEVEEFAKTNGITKGESAVKLWKQDQLGQPRSTAKVSSGTKEYIGKIQKVDPRNGTKLRQLAIEEGQRLLGEAARSRRAS